MHGLFIVFLILSSCIQAQQEEILFSSSRNGNSDIFIMDSQGTILRQITDSPLEEWSPVWINTTEISYLQQNGDQINIIRHNIQTNETSLIAQPDNCILDDKNILYQRGGKLQAYGCKGEIFIVDGATSAINQITSEVDGTATYIAWASETKISFTSNHEGNNEIYVYDVESKKRTNLSNHPANDERGDISSDGKFLVFSTNRFDENQQDIAIQSLETGAVTRVTNTTGNELIARWSLDNNYIYYGGNSDGNWELYRYDIANGTTSRLTENDSFDGDPRVR